MSELKTGNFQLDGKPVVNKPQLDSSQQSLYGADPSDETNLFELILGIGWIKTCVSEKCVKCGVNTWRTYHPVPFEAQNQVKVQYCSGCDPSTEDQKYEYKTMEGWIFTGYKYNCEGCNEPICMINSQYIRRCKNCDPSDDHNKYVFKPSLNAYCLDKIKTFNSNSNKHTWGNRYGNNQNHHICNKCIIDKRHKEEIKAYTVRSRSGREENYKPVKVTKNTATLSMPPPKIVVRKGGEIKNIINSTSLVKKDVGPNCVDPNCVRTEPRKTVHIRIAANLLARLDKAIEHYTGLDFITVTNILSYVSEFPETTLTNLDLSKAAYSNLVLEKSNFQNCIFTGADFSKCNLNGVNFADCDLSDANLSGATLTGCNFSGASLFRANLTGCDMTDANLVSCDMSYAVMAKVKLLFANFHSAIMEETNLTEANISGVDLSVATLTKVVLDNSNLELAKIKNNVLDGSSLVAASLKHCKLVNVSLKDCNISGADLSSICFVRCNLKDANMSRCISSSISIEESSCVGTIFSDSRFDYFRSFKNRYDGANFDRVPLSPQTIKSITQDGGFNSTPVVGAN
jgi:uncharacterized protein YjbI with pentapeptide repeats